MAKSSIDIAESLARLFASTIFELRGEWRRLHRAPPPMRLSRDLLMRGITYKLQERLNKSRAPGKPIGSTEAAAIPGYVRAFGWRMDRRENLHSRAA
jgi:hypothetical protein